MYLWWTRLLWSTGPLPLYSWVHWVVPRTEPHLFTAGNGPQPRSLVVCPRPPRDMSSWRHCRLICKAHSCAGCIDFFTGGRFYSDCASISVPTNVCTACSRQLRNVSHQHSRCCPFLRGGFLPPLISNYLGNTAGRTNKGVGTNEGAGDMLKGKHINLA